jgi:hypothetical protein
VSVTFFLVGLVAGLCVGLFVRGRFELVIRKVEGERMKEEPLVKGFKPKDDIDDEKLPS